MQMIRDPGIFLTLKIKVCETFIYFSCLAMDGQSNLKMIRSNPDSKNKTTVFSLTYKKIKCKGRVKKKMEFSNRGRGGPKRKSTFQKNLAILFRMP